MTTSVDHAEIKLGQILTMGLSIVAAVTHETAWVALLGSIFLMTVIYRPASPFVFAYRHVVQPLGLMHSDYRLDNIQPHTFGQLLGALTAAIATALLYWGYPIAGWSMVGILFALTLISYSGWCIGCFFYYQLHRLGLKGFFSRKAPEAGAAWGKRAKRNHGK